MLSFIAFPLSVTAQAPDFIPGKTQIVSAFGKVPGQDLIVHVLVLVPQGSDKNEIANEAVRQQGARPIDHTEFSLTGLEWTQTDNAGNVIVIQRYNPSGDPTGGGLGALLDTHTTWTGVSNSNFAFVDGGSTTDCPSLVRECPGRQTSDGNNDVAWLPLKSKNTLGVTWFNTKTVEADMAMNTKFSWSIDSPNTGIDVETVFLHENGHVVGLGHSDVTGAVMEAVYAGIRQTLHTDDECGIKTLYGTPGTECETMPIEQGNAAKATISYKSKSGQGGTLRVTVLLEDDSSNPVSDTSVKIRLLLDGSSVGTGTGTTNGEGKVTFRLSGAPSGHYNTTVLEVAGQPWDDEKNTEDPEYYK